MHMPPATASAVMVVLAISCLPLSASGPKRPVVVAHRGASGYLPEHTLAAKALAHGMGADFIEQDVVLSQDGQPIVLHDVHLDTVTDVAELFPRRARADGRFYAIDFTLAEIRTLRVTERLDLKTNRAVYPRRFPARQSQFRVATLAEEIELIQGLNRSTGRTVGIYTEIKAPAWHRAQGKDISRIVLDTLGRYGYQGKHDAAYLQCFDPTETRRIRQALGCRLRLVQLIGENDWSAADADYEQLRTPSGIQEVSRYADAIGPWMPHVVEGRNDEGRLVITPLVEIAHEHGLEVHPFTFRADSLPEYVQSFDELLRIFLVDAQVDGLFTDFPDLAVRARAALELGQ